MPTTKKKSPGRKEHWKRSKIPQRQRFRNPRHTAARSGPLFVCCWQFFLSWDISGSTQSSSGFFRELLTGLAGWGFYAVPPALLFAAFVLAFHRGRPVRLRTACILLFPLVLGVILHLFLSSGKYEITVSMFRELWDSGISLKSGGVFSGVLAVTFEMVFSRIGTLLVFFVLGAFMLLRAFNLTLSGIYTALSHYSHPAYKTEEDNLSSHTGADGKAVSRGYNIDIPMDDSPHAAMTSALRSEKKPGLFNRKPGVQTPDEVLNNQMAMPELEPVRNYTVKKISDCSALTARSHSGSSGRGQKRTAEKRRSCRCGSRGGPKH